MIQFDKDTPPPRLNLSHAYNKSNAAARAAAASSSSRPCWTQSYNVDENDDADVTPDQAEDCADDDVFFGDAEIENLEHDIAELEDCLATCDVTELSANEKETFAVEAQKLGKRVSKYIQVRKDYQKQKSNRGFAPKNSNIHVSHTG